MTLVLVFIAPAALRAQDVTEVTLKSAFLYNFVRFTEWPADALPAAGVISACVLGDPAVGDALAKTVRGRQIGGRPITVTQVEIDAPLPTCHLLYVSVAAAKRVVQVLSAVRDLPVLTVSDSEGFARRGGIVQLIIETGKMRFGINRKSAQRARLQLSSRLLALADLIEESATHRDLALPGTNVSFPASPFVEPPEAEERSVTWARPTSAPEAA